MGRIEGHGLWGQPVCGRDGWARDCGPGPGPAGKEQAGSRLDAEMRAFTQSAGFLLGL